jgi:SOS-response transcriptional repressor LexA
MRRYTFDPNRRPALTPMHRKVLWFISSRVHEGRRFPSHREIADHLGWRYSSSVASVLASLRGTGHLERISLSEWRMADDNHEDHDDIVATQKASCAVRTMLKRRGVHLSPTK